MSVTHRADPETMPDPGRLGVRRGDGADDPVTGPMPAVDLHQGRVRIHIDKGVTVVTLDGGLDLDFVGAISGTLRDAVGRGEPVVLDIDQVTLLDQAAFDALERTLDRAAPDAERSVVASRLSGRMVLERWGVTDRCAVFTSVADALQARAFQANGYGNGWQPND